MNTANTMDTAKTVDSMDTVSTSTTGYTINTTKTAGTSDNTNAYETPTSKLKGIGRGWRKKGTKDKESLSDEGEIWQKVTRHGTSTHSEGEGTPTTWTREVDGWEVTDSGSFDLRMSTASSSKDSIRVQLEGKGSPGREAASGEDAAVRRPGWSPPKANFDGDSLSFGRKMDNMAGYLWRRTTDE